MQPPIPIFKRRPSKKPSVRVFLEGKDVTPRSLTALLFDQEEREIFVQERIPDQSSTMLIETASRPFKTYSLSKLVSALYKQTFDRKNTVSQSFITSTQENLEDLRIKEENENITTEFIATVLPKPELAPKMPASVSILLVETETQFLLDLPSKTVDKLSDTADVVEQSNARYHYLTVGKGRNRKMVHAETQTTDSMRMPHATEAIMAQSKQSHAFASVWDMYDTYLQDDAESKQNMQIKDENVTAIERSVDTLAGPQEDSEMLKLLDNESFHNAVRVLERLLSNNTFNAQQKRFRGLSEPDPFRENVEYNYRLDLLWTFSNQKTKGQRVAAIAWCPENSDILAVGYGKFYFTDRNSGMVLLWNIKNPVQPEREYAFDSAVTSLGFAKLNPNLLAIGFYDGVVRVLDVSSREIRVIGQSSVTDSPCIEPVWKVVWYMGDDYYKEAEQVITITEDGRINKYRARDNIDMECIQIMRIAKPEGKLKGIDTLRRCPTLGIPITRYSAALAIRKHPADPNIYFIGTNEGTIHTCSRNYYTQHLNLFLAHNGPVYVMKFSPFCNKLFLTCGDDWMVRIWAVGIVEPLLELTKTMQSVQGADWSPTHSTVIANICGGDVYLWDLQRKAYLPQSITHSPTNSRNTVVQFNESGRCLVVGDIDGNVHLFSLEDMPLPAFFQENLLEQSILKALVTKPHLIKKLNKLGRLAFEKN